MEKQSETQTKRQEEEQQQRVLRREDVAQQFVWMPADAVLESGAPAAEEAVRCATQVTRLFVLVLECGEEEGVQALGAALRGGVPQYGAAVRGGDAEAACFVVGVLFDALTGVVKMAAEEVESAVFCVTRAVAERFDGSWKKAEESVAAVADPLVEAVCRVCMQRELDKLWVQRALVEGGVVHASRMERAALAFDMRSEQLWQSFLKEEVMPEAAAECVWLLFQMLRGAGFAAEKEAEMLGTCKILRKWDEDAMFDELPFGERFKLWQQVLPMVGSVVMLAACGNNWKAKEFFRCVCEVVPAGGSKAAAAVVMELCAWMKALSAKELDAMLRDCVRCCRQYRFEDMESVAMQVSDVICNTARADEVQQLVWRRLSNESEHWQLVRVSPYVKTERWVFAKHGSVCLAPVYAEFCFECLRACE